MKPSREGRSGGSVAGGVAKALFWALVVATPLLGAWFASSLAAYANRSTKLTALAGLLLFPVLPGAWEVVARLRERGKVVRRFLTLGDRLLLRTLAINVVFLGVLVGFAPASAVRAVSARGDWMLDGHDGRAARTTRRALLRLADSFDWLYRFTHETAYDDAHPKKKKDDDPPLPRADTLDEPGDAGAAPPPNVDDAGIAKPPPPAEAPFDPAHPWPSAPTIDPRVYAVPFESQQTIAALAQWLSAQESEPFRRFKLLHDWVADHISYDFPSLDDGSYTSKQDAARVLLARTGVCAGYANLLNELGTAAGYEIHWVGGVAKGAGGEVDGNGHAWNVVVIGGRSWLVDATWDAGHAKQGSTEHDRFAKQYKTDYLFTPAEVFGADHFPDEAKWQLRQTPISRGEFMRIPQLDPSFVAHGWKLVTPDRSQITVHDVASATLDDTGGRFLLAALAPQAGGVGKRCNLSAPSAPTITVDCPIPAPGTYRLVFFESPTRFGSYSSMGEISVLAQ